MSNNAMSSFGAGFFHRSAKTAAVTNGVNGHHNLLTAVDSIAEEDEDGDEDAAAVKERTLSTNSNRQDQK